MAESLDKHGVHFTTRLWAELLIPRLLFYKHFHPAGRAVTAWSIINLWTRLSVMSSAIVKVPSEPFDRAVGCFVTHWPMR